MSGLLDIDKLSMSYHSDDGEFKALREVSLSMNPGDSLGIVGESGCGKSSLSLTLMRLLPPSAKIKQGQAKFQGENVFDLGDKKMRSIRGAKMSMIFQEPMTSLNPYHRIGKQIMEMVLVHEEVNKEAAYKQAVEMLHKVGLDDSKRVMDSYAHELSGGMRQRVMIAIALILGPDLLIADEPTTALDVTTQKQILDLIQKMQSDLGMGLILITHDLAVVSGMCKDIAVMYAGEIVELGKTEDVFKSPKHPYTRALLSSIPRLSGDKPEKLYTIEGLPPRLNTAFQGCGFAPRCQYAEDRCRTQAPTLSESGSRCWLEPSQLKELAK